MEESYNVNLSACRFCDCMGLHLQVGIIAASFPFRSLLSIELDEELASGALQKMRTSQFGKKSCPVSYEVGFFKVSYVIWGIPCHAMYVLCCLSPCVRCSVLVLFLYLLYTLYMRYALLLHNICCLCYVMSYHVCHHCTSHMMMTMMVVVLVCQDFEELFADTEILYLDCNLLGPFLDEGMLLKTAFGCFRASPPGTHLLLLTRQSPGPSIARDFQRQGFKVIYQQKNTPSGTIGNFWLCEKI